MKIPSPIALVFLLVPATLPAQKAGGVDALLDQAIRRPGGYSQMCDIPYVKRAPELPLYGITLPTEYELSPVVLQKLRDRRDEVIEALVKRLEVMNFDEKPRRGKYQMTSDPNDPMEGEVLNTGLDPKQLSHLTLKIIMDLNAVECLPALLELEADLSKRLEKNAEDPKENPLPALQMDVGFVIEGGKFEEYRMGDKEPTPAIQKEMDAEFERVTAIVMQRDMLSTILVLLRQERYAPLLGSDLEALFVKAVKEMQDDESLKEIKSEEDIPEEEKSYIAWDPISKMAYYPGWPAGKVKYTPEVRQEIIDMARNYTKLPESKRRGAKGMTSRPLQR